jgi:hypothetical protein
MPASWNQNVLPFDYLFTKYYFVPGHTSLSFFDENVQADMIRTRWLALSLSSFKLGEYYY